MTYGPYGAMLRESTDRIREWNEHGEAEARAAWARRVECWLLHPIACQCVRGGR